MFKKIMGSLLAIVMLASMGTSVFAQDDSSEVDIDAKLDSIYQQYSGALDENILDDVIDGYRNASEFRNFYANDPVKGEKIILKAIKTQINVNSSPLLHARAIYQTPNAKAFAQKTSYYCGPAAVLQARVANGIWDTNISASESASLQDEFADIMGTDTTGTEQSQIGGAMNMAYFIWPYNIAWVSSSASDSSISPVINSSIQQGYAVIPHVSTGQLKYYAGSNTTHFITVYKADTSAKTYGVIDSNTNSNNKYFGLKSVTVNELCNAMRKSGGNSSYTYGSDN